MKYLKIFFIAITILLFMKSDFRLIDSINCCSDDHDYYSHALSIGYDFDFDYSNQLEGFETKRFYYNGKSAPSAFVGSGILASPFILIGKFLTLIFSIKSNNLIILIYSLSSYFYLVWTYILLLKIKKYMKSNLSNLKILLFFCGSGIIYYSFERYSMSHVYEVFLLTAVIYLSFSIGKQNFGKNLFFCYLVVCLGILTRWVNLYLFFIPILIYYYRFKNLKILKSKQLYINFFMNILIFAYFSNLVFGVVTFNPEFVYNTQNTLTKNIVSSNFIELIFQSLKSLYVILFSYEFGIFWLSPILFFLFLYSFTFLKNDKKMFIFLSMINFSVISVVIIWQTTASSYGFRYLFNLVPIGFFVLFLSDATKHKLIVNYLTLFSVVSILSVLFFETTKGTQLSIDYVENSFGIQAPYSQPEYFNNLLHALFNVNAYLKILATSMLGVIVIKSAIFIFGISNILLYINQFNVENNYQDLINYINTVNSYPFLNLFIFFTIILFSSFIIGRKITSNFN